VQLPLDESADGLSSSTDVETIGLALPEFEVEQVLDLVAALEVFRLRLPFLEVYDLGHVFFLAALAFLRFEVAFGDVFSRFLRVILTALVMKVVGELALPLEVAQVRVGDATAARGWRGWVCGGPPPNHHLSRSPRSPPVPLQSTKVIITEWSGRRRSASDVCRIRGN